MTSEIYIENKRLDISSEISSLLTFALDDIKDFAARNCTFSKTIVLPGTANNNKLFGHIFDVRISNSFNETADNVDTNFNPAVSADCLMFQNYMQVFKGTMRLLEIIITNGVPEYEVGVIGELGGLVSELGSKKLEDLDFSAYDQPWNASGITGTWDSLNGSGVCYPLIDVGTVSTNKDNYDIRAFRPALFVREYVDKIIQDAGYTWDSDLLDTDRFKKLVVPYNQKSLRSREISYVDADRDSTTTVVDNNITQANLSFETFTGNQWTANVDKSEFTYTGTDTVNFRVRFRVTGVSILFWAATYLRLRKNNTDVIAGTIKVLDVLNGAENYIWEKEVTVTMAQNDYLALWYFWGTVPTGSQNDVTAQTATLDIVSVTPVYTDITINDTVEVNECIPKNVLQKDFLSSVVKLFNLYIYEDRFTAKKLYISPYVDFFDVNASGVTNWTYKLDKSRATRLKPMSELNARFYNFLFKGDTDYYNDLYKKKYSETYGSRLYDSGYEFVDDKKDIELIFSPTILFGKAGEDKVVSAIYKKSSGVEETTDFNIRILQVKKITGVTSWNIMNGVTVLDSKTTYLYAGHYDDPDAPANDIHFGVPQELYFPLASGAINVTQFNVYWSPYMAEIVDKDSKLLVAWFKLTAQDIFALDFSKLIFCEGSYWRLNKIEDWNASEPDVCKVELLKVINTVY